ncbi:MAG: DUF29 domain-containing protein [Symploca sp. SIO3E6]|nr:DUF29 domain-containing protein [Caldora sp. SIO3E6]
MTATSSTPNQSQVLPLYEQDYYRWLETTYGAKLCNKVQ